MLEISTASLEYVKVPVHATKNGVAFDPSGDVVKMTFSMSEHLGATPTWYDADWEDMSGGHLARCLIGPGTTGEVQLTEGVWWVFVQITDNPEAPAMRAGPVLIY